MKNTKTMKDTNIDTIQLKNKGKWTNLEYKISNPSILSKPILLIHLNKLWKDVIEEINENQHVLFIFRLKFTNNQIATISTLKKINKNNKDELLTYLMDRLNLSNENYNITPINSIIFSYGIREGNIISEFNSDNYSPDSKFQTYYNNKLPITYKIEEYGKILSKKGKQYLIKCNKNAMIILNTTIKNKKIINNVQYLKNGNILFTWVDRMINEDSFTREIGKSIYQYQNNELLLMQVVKKTKPIIKTKVDNKLDNKIIVMDLETIMINNVHVPYLLSWYDGVNCKSYFIESLNTLELELNILKMIESAINAICIRKYKSHKIYLHNFSKFDGYFLIKYLSKLGHCDPIIHKGRIISINFTSFNSTYNITFKDSYLLLPSALRELGKSFNVKSLKGIFPYKMSDINYNGVVPDYKYFNKITLDEYNNYKKNYINKWNFKNESIKYCELDCISLFEILNKFNHLIFNKFSLNINKYPTLPSLSFAIFRCHYLINDNIHMLSGSIAKDIRKGYTGGSVDMFIPKPDTNKQVFCYDVNALYPFSMSKFKIPVGNPIYFEGDILNKKLDFSSIFISQLLLSKNKSKKEDLLTQPFGFFYCKITSPEYLKHPIIQTHIKNKNGMRTVSPLGTWNDILFSEEIYNAIKLGYKFEVKWGYLFEYEYIFKDIINDLYQLRLEYPKSDPMNYIAKIIMNSLYGRFGMDDNFVYSYIMNKQDYIKFENNFKDSMLAGVIDIIVLENYYLVQVKNPQVELDTILDNGTETHNINIAIASAISAYSRIHMSQFKNRNDFNLYYTDTDSIYIDKPLDDSFISNTELGKLKLERICNKAIFLSPKVYGLQDEKGNEIIKIKGLTKESMSNININTLELLLKKDNLLEFTQNKWYKDLSNANITVNEQIYTLKVTDNKRKLIYKNELLVDTTPFIINC